MSVCSVLWCEDKNAFARRIFIMRLQLGVKHRGPSAGETLLFASRRWRAESISSVLTLSCLMMLKVSRINKLSSQIIILAEHTWGVMCWWSLSQNKHALLPIEGFLVIMSRWLTLFCLFWLFKSYFIFTAEITGRDWESNTFKFLMHALTLKIRWICDDHMFSEWVWDGLWCNNTAEGRCMSRSFNIMMFLWKCRSVQLFLVEQ